MIIFMESRGAGRKIRHTEKRPKRVSMNHWYVQRLTKVLRQFVDAFRMKNISVKFVHGDPAADPNEVNCWLEWLFSVHLPFY